MGMSKLCSQKDRGPILIFKKRLSFYFMRNSVTENIQCFVVKCSTMHDTYLTATLDWFEGRTSLLPLVGFHVVM